MDVLVDRVVEVFFGHCVVVIRRRVGDLPLEISDGVAHRHGDGSTLFQVVDGRFETGLQVSGQLLVLGGRIVGNQTLESQ